MRETTCRHSSKMRGKLLRKQRREERLQIEERLQNGKLPRKVLRDN